MLKPESYQHFKEQLNLAFEDILGQGFHLSGGHHFDDVVANILISRLNEKGFYQEDSGKRYHFKEISSKVFKEHYGEYKKRSGTECFDFNDLNSPTDQQSDFLIVRQPNGSQRWPDILIIANGVGLPIEIKSGKKDQIVWNGGMPRLGHLYIFNSYAKVGTGTTMFLGEEIIGETIRSLNETFHEQLQTLAKAHNEKIKNLHRQQAEKIGVEPETLRPSPWGYYPRAMYTNNESYFDNEKIRLEREQRAKDFIQQFEFKSSLTIKSNPSSSKMKNPK